jgi:alpha-mannosidase
LIVTDIPLPEVKSVFTVDKQNVFIDAVKRAESNKTDLIVRIVELYGGQTRVKFGWNTGLLNIVKVSQCNAIETATATTSLSITKGSVSLSLKPFQFVTLRLNTQ